MSGNKFRIALALPVAAVMNCADNTGAKNLYVVAVAGAQPRFSLAHRRIIPPPCSPSAHCPTPPRPPTTAADMRSGCLWCPMQPAEQSVLATRI